MSNNLLKTTYAAYFGFGNVINEDPDFKEANKENYHLLDNSSPAYRNGTDLTLDPDFPTYLFKDLDGVARDNMPTIGCFEVP